MKLFEEKTRTNSEYKKHMQGDYDFYDNTCRPEFVIIRNKLEQWFSNYPETDQFELKKRFIKKEKFSPAFYELYIHEMFRKQGFRLEPHPIIKGTNNRPDFLVKGNDIQFYLEATVATDLSIDERKIKNIIGNLYDFINSKNIPRFSIALCELILKSTTQPSGNKIINSVYDNIDKYGHLFEIHQKDPMSFNYPKIFKFDDNTIFLSYSLFFKARNESTPEKLPTIIKYPNYTRWGGTQNTVIDSLKEKASKYGKPPLPYLICINSTSDISTGNFDVFNALFGREKLYYPSQQEDFDAYYGRSMDGILGNKLNPRHTRVSAVLITEKASPSQINPKHWLVLNPFASKPLDYDKIQLSKLSIESNQIIEIPGKGLYDIMKSQTN